MSSKKVSLHIGLNKVDAAHYQGWDGELLCCENDAQFYRELAEKSKFDEVKILLTQNATSKEVQDYLDKSATTLEPGDLLFLTYSGHGGTMRDLNFDEEDLQDETWCLYDRNFVDDELFEAFSKFKPGVRVFMVSDSCHSGSVSRVAPSPEELAIRMQYESIYKNLRTRNAPQKVMEATYRANIDAYKAILERKPVDANSIGAFVLLFAACQDNQKAAEWENYGLFTTMIKRVFENEKKFADYNDIFEKAKKEIPGFQVPNLYTFGNPAHDFVKDKPFFMPGSPTTNPTNPTATNSTESEADELIIDGKGIGGQLRGAGESRTGKKEEHMVIRTRSADKKVWDQAYQQYFELYKNKKDSFVEPNIKSLYSKPEPATRSSGNEYLSNWPRPEANPPYTTEFIWHLDDNHSQLRKAVVAVKEKDPAATVRIGHLDTGYLPEHPSLPKSLLKDLGKSFVNKDPADNKAIDRVKTGTIAEQDGHGTATLAILAGNNIQADHSYANYQGEFGAVPFAEVVPIRICDTVFNFFNANDVADGIDYAVDNGCEVITMSMAGYPTRRVAKAVNNAYEKGVTIVTAAGNNWDKGLQKITPKAVMYPARFERVIAATGACYNHEPYDLDANTWLRMRSDGGEFMQGNWGPEKAMSKAIAAYTPNVAWATMNPAFKFSKSGGGTSSATPQVAATAALWIAYNRKALKDNGLAGTWKQVEAVRTALFRSASKAYPAYKKYYGNGIIRAFDALNAFDFIKETASLKESGKASVSFFGITGFIGQWFRSRAGNGTAADAGLESENLKEMVSLEIIQLLYRDPALYKYTEALEFDNKKDAFLENKEAMDVFKSKVKQSPYASEFLKSIL